MIRTITTAILTITALSACRSSDEPTAIGPTTVLPAHRSGVSAVERGKYLVTLGGCNDCHTPMTMTGPDMTRLLSGHPADAVLPPPPAASGPWMINISMPGTAYSGPWGTTYTANLTPDKETGIGAWTAETFIATIRTGRHMGSGRPLLPPMPTENLKALTDEDLRAMFAYLQSVPAISNKVHEPQAPTTAAVSAPAPKRT